MSKRGAMCLGNHGKVNVFTGVAGLNNKRRGKLVHTQFQKGFPKARGHTQQHFLEGAEQ